MQKVTSVVTSIDPGDHVRSCNHKTWLPGNIMLGFNCWVLHPVARVSTNAFLKTTVRNNVSVLDFIVHYLLHFSAPIGGHLQVKCTQNILR
jgi:hypothetical protein